MNYFRDFKYIFLSETSSPRRRWKFTLQEHPPRDHARRTQQMLQKSPKSERVIRAREETDLFAFNLSPSAFFSPASSLHLFFAFIFLFPASSIRIFFPLHLLSFKQKSLRTHHLDNSSSFNVPSAFASNRSKTSRALHSCSSVSAVPNIRIQSARNFS